MRKLMWYNNIVLCELYFVFYCGLDDGVKIGIYFSAVRVLKLTAYFNLCIDRTRGVLRGIVVCRHGRIGQEGQKTPLFYKC